jgi:dihydropteroate synthase
MKDTTFSSKFHINHKGKLIDLSIPKVMGIVNVTPDSFYDGGTLSDENDLLKRVGRMVEEGTDFIDVGGCSTKPGSNEISTEEELGRVLPAIKQINKAFPNLPISIDTYRSKVAKLAIEEGAGIVNDISGGTLDNKMISTVIELKVPYIATHIQGTPSNMQDSPTYKNVSRDIVKRLSKIKMECFTKGFKDLIVDPGFGFGKTTEQNFKLLKDLKQFELLGLPILVGLSRKSMIYKTVGETPKEALNGTTALHMVALQNGANILRVHDVKEAKECINLFLALKSA